MYLSLPLYKNYNYLPHFLKKYDKRILKLQKAAAVENQKSALRMDFP